MSKVRDLKELLFDTLIDHVKNGVDVVTKQGEVVHVDAPAPYLSVAAKMVKDFADEAKDDTEASAKVEKLSQYLAARRPDLKNSLPN